jgi:DNA-dependent metalloprotease WSS1
MREHDALITMYSHLKDFPREKEALHTLQKIASMVKPIMRARGWRVGELAEFFPDQPNLLGLNVDRGRKIMLRLRYPGDRSQFLPLDQVTDTMLHELSHNVYGPHDAKFHALWNQLRDEHLGLVMKGYTGEGFLSEGHVLGGKRMPRAEAQRLARAAAEKREKQNKLAAGSGQRLGGSRPRPGSDIRRTIVDAISRRGDTLQGCGNTNHDDKEIRQISEAATRNGFRTQAEEDAANEAAIAQALWEMVQEDEQRRYGASYIPPSAEVPEGNGGWLEDEIQATSRSAAATPPLNGYYAPKQPPPPPPVPAPSTRPQAPPATYGAPRRRSASPARGKGWTCNACTLHNPAQYLCCEVCGTERSEEQTRQLAGRSSRCDNLPIADMICYNSAR